MKTKIISGVFVLFFFAIAAVVLYAHMSGTDVPKVEIEARFRDADRNGDGSLSKEEFAKYLVTQNRQKIAVQDEVRICPTTGAPCTGEGMCSSGNGEACGGGGEGGCCGGKSKADGAADGCCGGKNKTVDVTAGEKTESDCCSSKSGTEKKEGECCKMKADAEKKEVTATETETVEKE